MKHIFLIIAVFCASQSDAQNLLLNPSFEDTLLRTTQLYLPSSWTTPTTGSPDLMTNLNTSVSRQVPQNFAGYQFAHSGSNYMGMLMYYLYNGSGGNPLLREYIQNDISPVLQQDSIYCLQLFVSLADSFIHASKNKLGVYFSTTRIQSNNSNYLPYTPQIMVSPDSFITEKQAWLEYNFQYKAAGGERYITIGNFSDSSSVDTIFVGGGIRSDPNNLGTYYYLDDIYLGSCDSVPVYTSVGLKENLSASTIAQHDKLKVFPNPATNQVSLAFEVRSNEQFNFLLYDLHGRLLHEQQLQQGKLHHISLEQIKKGLYLYQVRNGKGEFLSGKLIVE